MRLFTAAVGAVAICLAASPMSAAGNTKVRYQKTLDQLRTELTAKIPKTEDAAKLDQFLSSDALDDKLVTFAVLHEATPEGLAGFADQGKEQAMLVNSLLNEPDLMKAMLVADGAKAPKQGRGFGPAQYGPAAKIFADIHKASKKASSCLLYTSDAADE